MRRWIALLCFACALASAQAQSPAPEAVLPLEPYRKTIALRATVGGREGLFLFDTAGGLSLISPSFAEKIGRKPWGRLTGHQMLGQRLDTPRCDDLEVKLGRLQLKAPVVGVLDIMTLFPKDAAPVEGSSGPGSFRRESHHPRLRRRPAHRRDARESGSPRREAQPSPPPPVTGAAGARPGGPCGRAHRQGAGVDGT